MVQRRALNSPDMREDLKQAFEAIDQDKDKLISFSDLKAFL
jgi:Ca2+-binding EF-hand superfamily protein